MKKLTALLLSFVLACAMAIIPNTAFADESADGLYMATQINGGVYQPEGVYYLMTYDGLYYTKAFYKDAFGIEITENGDKITAKKGDKTILEFAKTDLFDIDDETQIEMYAESTTNLGFYLFEAFADKLPDDLYFNWEVVRDLKTDSPMYRNVTLLTSKDYFNDSLELFDVPVAIKPEVLKDMKNLQSYIKKMSKKPTVNGSGIKFTDKSGSLELILNGNPDDPTLSDFNIVINGKLSTDAIALLTAALKDIVPAAESKTVIDQLKRLSNVAASPKTDQKTYDKLVKRTYNPWYELGDNHKFMYKFDVVEKKTFVDFYITGFYMDTTDYND